MGLVAGAVLFGMSTIVAAAGVGLVLFVYGGKANPTPSFPTPMPQPQLLLTVLLPAIVFALSIAATRRYIAHQDRVGGLSGWAVAAAGVSVVLSFLATYWTFTLLYDVTTLCETQLSSCHPSWEAAMNGAFGLYLLCMLIEFIGALTLLISALLYRKARVRP
jgi:hypothetical protein